MKTTVTTVATVNKVDIQIIEDGERRVAVKPICDALGISIQGQLEVLKNHPIYGSTVKIILTVGADEKQREMVTIPLEFVFGWLMNIDSRKVNSNNREALLRYQLECHHALYTYFTRNEDYLNYRQNKMAASFARQFEARTNFAQAKNLLNDANVDFRKWMTYSMEEYEAEKAQMKLDFTEGKETEHDSN